MRATHLKTLIKATQPMLRPLCIEGPPGGGKTSVVEQCAKELELPIIVKHLPTMLVEDFGVPDITTTPMAYKVPGWFPDAADPALPRRAYCSSTTATKLTLPSRRYWRTSPKPGSCTVTSCLRAGAS